MLDNEELKRIRNRLGLDSPCDDEFPSDTDDDGAFCHNCELHKLDGHIRAQSLRLEQYEEHGVDAILEEDCASYRAEIAALKSSLADLQRLDALNTKLIAKLESSQREAVRRGAEIAIEDLSIRHPNDDAMTVDEIVSAWEAENEAK